MHRAAFLALAVLSLALAACSAGTGGDWPIPDLKGPLADCHALGDVCGGSGWCGSTRESVLVCCPVALEEDGIHCPGPGAPGVTECVVDADCPHQDCREAPSCLAGMCFAAKQAVRTYCSVGACSEDGVCEPCNEDADCEAVNTNECYRLTCTHDGTCEPKQLDEGASCLKTSGGTCNSGATCLTN